jgi:streptogramin lyase
VPARLAACLLAGALSLLLAVPAGAVRFTEFPLGEGVDTWSDVAAGPDGNPWFLWSGLVRDGLSHQGIGVFDVPSERAELLPAEGWSDSGMPVVAGGGIWMQRKNFDYSAQRFTQLYRVDAATHLVETIDVPGFWETMVAGADDTTIYAIDNTELGRPNDPDLEDVFELVAFDTTTRTVIRRTQVPWVGLAGASSDGMLWAVGSVWTGVRNMTFSRIDPVSGQVSPEYTAATPVEFVHDYAIGAGGELWLNLVRDGGNRRTLGRVDLAGNVTEYETYAPGKGGDGIVPHPDGSLFYSPKHTGGLVRLDPQTGDETIAVPPTAGDKSLSSGYLAPDGRTLWYLGGLQRPDGTWASNVVKVELDAEGTDQGGMDSVLGAGLGTLVPCDGPCRGSVDVVLLRRQGARGATASAAAASVRRVRVAGQRVRGKGTMVLGTRFSRRARRLVRAQGRTATLRVTVRVRPRAGGRARVVRKTVVLKRAASPRRGGSR